jgi:ribosomal protein S18 acetylase RimI-like enzyme
MNFSAFMSRRSRKIGSRYKKELSLASTMIQPEVFCMPMSLERHDLQRVAYLIHQSAPDLFALMFGRRAVSILTGLVGRSHNHFSHRYVRVAESDKSDKLNSQVLGIAIVLPAEKVEENFDYVTVLRAWEQWQLQIANKLILDRLLQHRYPAGTFYIANLAVDAAHRGKGIGTRLLQRCIADAEAAQASAVYISVSINNPRAQKLYQSLGFRVVNIKTLGLGRMTVGSRILELGLNQDRR